MSLNTVAQKIKSNWLNQLAAFLIEVKIKIITTERIYI